MVIIALPLVVALTYVGAVLAWRSADPVATQPAFEPTGSWAAARPESIEQVVAANAAVWRQRVELTVARSGARRSAAAWATSHAAGAQAPRAASGIDARQPVAASSRQASRRIAAFTGQLSGLPVARTRFVVTSVKVDAAAPLDRPAHVEGQLAVDAFEGEGRVRQLTSDVTAVVRPQRQGRAFRDVRRTRWRIADVRFERAGALALDRPVVVRRAGVDVFAPARRAHEAREYAVAAAALMPRMRSRWSTVSTTDALSIYVVERPRQVPALLSGPVAVRTPERETPGWTHANGDVVLVGPLLDGFSTPQRMGALRHELAHAMTLPLFTGSVPLLWAEGVATWEEYPYVLGSAPNLSLSIADVRAGFRDGSLRYRELLSNRSEMWGLRSEALVERAYGASFATVAYVEMHEGHGRLLALLAELRRGTQVDAALRRTLGYGERRLEQRVRAWVDRQVADGGVSTATLATRRGQAA